ncbi:MAG: hypothetical protein HY692_01325 [Cyanobacteria bacterium NC_groundwater_1444_Ag_S-0.65um_54_12]|nr:hypothetical protein [Cyanobacteria bacterium NC_groundwater_1444_Ag_S-0.65um_54_12]
MAMRKAVAIGIIAALFLVGCGRDDGTGVPIVPEPVTEPQLPVNPNPGYPGTGPGVVPTQPPTQLQQVTVTVSSKSKHGGFLFWGKKVKAELAVTNPNNVQVSATLTITFSKDGQSVETQTQSVDLGPGENKTLEVKATKTSDDISANATNNTPSGGTGGGYPGGNYPPGGSSPGSYSGGTTPGGTGVGSPGGLPY